MPSGSRLYLVWRHGGGVGSFGRFGALALARGTGRSFALLLFFFFCLLGEFALAFCKIIVWLCQLVVLSG